MNGLTTLQERCLTGVITYVQRHGKAPTRRELAKALGQKSLNGIRQLLIALEKKGRVRIDPPKQARNIILLAEHGQLTKGASTSAPVRG